jgi:hypothetical protein
MPQPYNGLPSAYHTVIDWIGDGTGLSDAILHIHAGMAIFLAVRLVTGRSLASWAPISLVALAEAANEVLDRLHYGSWRWADTSADILNTLFWPTVIFTALRLRPVIDSARRRAHDAGSRVEA